MSTHVQPQEEHKKNISEIILEGIDTGGIWTSSFLAKICKYSLSFAVIYLAIQASIPTLRSTFLLGVAMSIVLAAPELMIGGLFVEAMDKWAENKVLGVLMFFISALFLSVGILTMWDIFIWHLPDGSAGQNRLTVYRAIIVICFSAVHGVIHTLEKRRHDKEVAIVQANDDLALENRRQLAMISQQQKDIIVELKDQIKDVQQASNDRIQKLGMCIQNLEESIQNRIQTYVQPVDNKLETTVLELKRTVCEVQTSVTRVHSDVHTINATIQDIQAYTPPLTPAYYNADNAVNNSSTPQIGKSNIQFAIDAPHSSSAHAPDSMNSLALPSLEVQGVSSKKVTQVLSLYLCEGKNWMEIKEDLKWNYSRDIKPIRDAYEAYEMNKARS